MSSSTIESAGSSTSSRTLRNAVIRFAGNSQDGIQSIGGFLARLAGRTAQEVMTYMTIPSTISGGPSIFQVHIGSGQVLTSGDEADVLVAFYQHSYDGHISSLRDGGICLYDSTPTSMERDAVVNLKHERGIKHIGIPFTSATVEAVGGSPRDRGKNMFVMGLICAVFNLDRDKLVGIIARQFGKKDEQVLRNAMLAFDAGYAYQVGDLDRFFFEHGEAEAGHRISTDGNQMLTLGLLAAGVRYGAAYPITPWSTIMETLRTELPKYGGIYVQAEDELAAVSLTIGAAFAGHLAVTGSSGPGLSLKMEALSYASMAELPLIVINVQRGGPSTGLPTSVEQSDLMQAIYGSHGDCPRIVLAPQDVEDCFYIALEAGKLARKYSCPVIILSDQALSSRIEAFHEPDVDMHWVEPTLNLTPKDAEFKPYPLERTTHHAAPGTKMLGGKYPVVTGLEHDEWGHPSGSPKMHSAMTNKRRRKLLDAAAEIAAPKVHGDLEGDVLLVGWGSTYGPLRESTDRLRAEGYKAGHLHLRHIHPLPNGIQPVLNHYKHIVVVEMNDYGAYGYGQLAMLLRARFCNPAIRSVCKTDGLAFRIKDIVTGVEKHLAGVD
ncbi:2-oxoacid:acceptor oxidoreductase subunit alpha [Roseimicrobium sp. ORNL1]|uniref:2-oxoacid:acceptor oxidoreductase subunit alpha n=1 Tax=Roseimicrobium sp. ORNL1 TaxID=2711231 RepID=UPI0013E1B002|nr:2-oxoacid:acceptor oxidoreductase subunit alpha [Roseimicrobium sp. ORNL1]QIF00464.1 2-oxoacid:acceptor oxidoreductase subunit alpha [Roseimicrobium sp. ORNL1]